VVVVGAETLGVVLAEGVRMLLDEVLVKRVRRTEANVLGPEEALAGGGLGRAVGGGFCVVVEFERGRLDGKCVVDGGGIGG
jgi:hypothetical protein